jgi:lantibiotic modifying enzyme
MGIYALERCPRKEAKKRVEVLVQHLEHLSDRYDKGTTWFTAPGMLRPGTRQHFPKGYFDLGLAHGAAGVIAFLAYVHKAGIAQEISRRLLHSSVSWLMGQRRADSSGSLFPGIVVPPDRPMPSTFSWSRGDPGIAAALLPAIQCIGESARENPALEIAHASLKRIPHIPFTDPTLCNGTAGLAHLFNRLYQATGDESLKNAARTLFEKTLSLRKPGQGVAGFSREGFNDERDIVDLYDPGLIQGAAGIGLALLAAASELEPAWDHIILLPGPQNRQA